MSRAVVFHSTAIQEFEDAALWYEARHRGLGAQFVEAIRDRVRAAAANPDQFAPIHRDLRCARTKRFPYLIVFRAEPERIVVLAVYHARRDPQGWRGRA